MNSTVSPWAWPESSAWKTRWIAITTIASLKNSAYDAAHGVSPRRALTTNQVTAMISTSGTGLSVRLAAAASPSAHSHHAPGCRTRG